MAGRRAWTARWTDAAGKRRTQRFGYEGEVSRGDALAAWRRWLADRWPKLARPAGAPLGGIYRTRDLCSDYLAWAKTQFIKRGELTSHVWTIAYAMQALMDKYGHLPANEITNPMIARLRDVMVRSGKRTLSRKTVNGRLFAIKAAFRWARERELVGRETLADVLAVKPLGRRSDAKAPRKIKPVPEDTVMATLAHLPPQVEAMVRLQWLTGMRPGEVCAMRPIDIDTTGDIWLYRPQGHKTEHLGQTREVPLGAQAQAVLRPWLNRDVQAHCFSPREAQQHRLAIKRAGRKTPPYPSHMKQRASNPAAALGTHYNAGTYRKAICHACAAAGVPRWNPNQLRHAWATRMKQQFGIEMTSAGMGHASIDTTQLYGERASKFAIEIARRVG